MSPHLNRLLTAALATIAVTVVLSGCSHADAARRDTGKSAQTASTPTANASASASANGTLAAAPAAAAPRDSISDRADHGRIVGDSTAKLWVIMASDFQCPYCKAWHDAAFTSLMNDYVKTGKIRLAFLNMPLSIHPNAMPASEAAMCASVQNKFWPMHEALFATQQSWETLPNPAAKFDTIAGSLGVNLPAYRTCVTKHLTVPLIQADHDRARAAGVNSTPTFFVGNQTLTGSDANLRGAIDAALKTAKPAR
jgi:protein-disulfide isomerase